MKPWTKRTEYLDREPANLLMNKNCRRHKGTIHQKVEKSTMKKNLHFKKLKRQNNPKGSKNKYIGDQKNKIRKYVFL